MSKNTNHTVEVRPNHFEPMSDELVKRCDGDTEMAGFFHCLGVALRPTDNQVDSKHLKANLPEHKGR
ncbi:MULTISPECIES: hypothetical protein [Vibrio]|uniref:Uncharacterized protein n=4 Tax=Vibrio TaxID=662 RepID=A0AAN0SJM2_9VIBR|nr:MULTISPECIES: hypothetical protein [Vibrio]CAH1588638.1 conserved hypothetical protein [Vibrio jasicida]AIW22350.1 hypothetical protein IX92_25095 [Vibrio coralliilyticus]KIF53280.1 hypothetical protein H735_10175 [Vibrio owensii CAIM 1854 = LMG 25443]MCZ2799005.1 hypothetical protein [Vibrio alginolyticus]NOH36904.1 hypothetical protein [Vibrio coralliilyticus]